MYFTSHFCLFNSQKQETALGYRASLIARAVKNLPANAGDTGDLGLIPGLGKSPGEGNGYPFQYSCLENPMDRQVWQATVHRVAKNWTRRQKFWVPQRHTQTKCVNQCETSGLHFLLFFKVISVLYNVWSHAHRHACAPALAHIHIHTIWDGQRNKKDNLQTQTFLVAQMVKYLPTLQKTQVWSLGREDPLEKEMTTHSSILAWEIPRTEEPGRLQSMGKQRVGHNWLTSLQTQG